MKHPRSASRDAHVARWRNQLAAWMAERAVEAWLRDPEEDAAASAEEPAEAVVPQRLYILQREAEARWAVGDIVLLRPLEGAVRWGPVYGVLLEPAGPGQWLLVPFSRYATPAVPGEWKTGLVPDALRVLCLWNARETGAGIFLPGRIKKMDARWVENTQALYRHVMNGDPLPDKDIVHFGPPLHHPADERYDYLEEEIQRLDDHGLAPPERQAAHPPAIADEPAHPSAWLLAAEGRSGYGRPDKPEA